MDALAHEVDKLKRAMDGRDWDYSRRPGKDLSLAEKVDTFQVDIFLFLTL